MRGAKSAFDVDPTTLHSPFPRAYGWVDGSAYINHIVLVRKARGAEPLRPFAPTRWCTREEATPSWDPRDGIPLANTDWGCDFESEIAVVMDDTPQGVQPEDVGQYIRLVMLCNDVSLET